MSEALKFDPEAVIKKYKEKKPHYDAFADFLQALLKKIAKDLDVYPIIQGRAKSLESFAEKIQRADKDYEDPLNDITDLCGVRFITHTTDEVDKVQNILEEYFDIDEKNSEDKQEKLPFNQFGYLSRHFIVNLKKDPNLAVCPLPKEIKDNIKHYKAELQLRTLAQHIWADVYHELGYKNEFQLPVRWKRDFARTAAMLENVDKIFQEVKNDISSLESNYGDYMEHEDLKALIDRFTLLMEIDGNTNILHRLIKTYVAQSDWKKVEETYRKYTSLAESHGPILRDVGMALCKNNKHEYDSEEFNEGLKLLQKAIKMDETDVEALSNLGGVYFKNRDKNNDYLKNSRDCYKKAHIIAPENPYPLGNYIACELLMKKDPDILAYFKPIIERAQNLCIKQIEVKTNIPWAYFDLGTFYLYLEKLEESKNYFEQAIQNSSYDWMVSTCRERIQTFIDKGIDIKNLEDINTLLKKGEKEVRDRNNTAA